MVTKSSDRAFIPFLALGIAFVAIGLGGKVVFFWLGVTFLILGAAFAAKSRRSRSL